MRVRIRFSKTGALVYIGHLDVMRYFQKLFRRAGIPVAYSEGFSPHQILSFTPPLPLGMESFGEYADVELTDTISTNEAMKRLAAESVPEITIMSFKALGYGCEKAMAAVRAAKYSVTFNSDYDMSKIENAAQTLMAKNEHFVVKKTKKSENSINLRPLIHELTVSGNELIMTVSSGSTDNIKPELVLGAINDISPVIGDMSELLLRRIDQYTYTDSYISLDMIGEDIP